MRLLGVLPCLNSDCRLPGSGFSVNAEPQYTRSWRPSVALFNLVPLLCQHCDCVLRGALDRFPRLDYMPGYYDILACGV